VVITLFVFHSFERQPILLKPLFVTQKRKGMKTILLGLAFVMASLAAASQDTRTTYDALKVVTTSTGLAAQLTWKKGAENIAYFIVERSTDGIDFKQCAIVFTSDDPAFVDYKFRDKIGSLSQGLVYRVGIVNDQKRVSYLPAKTLIAPEAL
jgi:hypothetical protein